jgi:hypothetical protein
VNRSALTAILERWGPQCRNVQGDFSFSRWLGTGAAEPAFRDQQHPFEVVHIQVEGKTGDELLNIHTVRKDPVLCPCLSYAQRQA